MACRYPDADNAQALWENVLVRRRAFRQIPDSRLNSNYFSNDPASPDTIYSTTAALLRNYHFDRARFNVSKNNFQTADLAHWLALEVADEALKDAGLSGPSLPTRERTGVIIGNTLTGEQTRANVMRLRWPYVAASIAQTLQQQNWENQQVSSLLQQIEANYKSNFPPMEEDSLAGGLSNTIAGRICNYFDFKGGGFTIDGACSSSLLAIAKACDAIANKELLLALAGGVDISLDPFELVGFSRAGALAKQEMLVYDRHSNGFWPGEGCGFIVLADYDFAVENGLNIVAVIKGWGISSDGNGGLTRPEVNGQYLALKRAYEKAGYPLGTVSYLEGHGTGTQTGDTTELSAVLKLLEEQVPQQPVYIGSVKANIGHTKAAAGIAGFIKAVQALRHQLIPAITGNSTPHPLFGQQQYLQLPDQPVAYNRETPFRAGISSMGFGGINTHITIEEITTQRALAAPLPPTLHQSTQDTELFLLAEPDLLSLRKKLQLLNSKAGQLSLAELTDLSCTLHSQLQPGKYRAAIEASTPAMLAQKIEKLLVLLEGEAAVQDHENGIYYAHHTSQLRIGLLFPGQGNDVLLTDSLLTQRFPSLKALIPAGMKKALSAEDLLRTDLAQPAIVGTSLFGVKLLEQLGITASVALGHSVGELAALAWAGILTMEESMALATWRGKLMHHAAAVKGKMLSVKLSSYDPALEEILNDSGASIACINSPSQVVLSGSVTSIQKACDRCSEKNIPFVLLKVENAFHSTLMKAIATPFADYMEGVNCSKPARSMFSTVSGQLIRDEKEITAILNNQLTQPVLFYKAFSEAAGMADCWIEAGAGSTLTNMVKSFSNAPVIPLNVSGKTVSGMARITGWLFVAGYPVQHSFFFGNRFFRTMNLDDELSFIENPCESIQVPYKSQAALPTFVTKAPALAKASGNTPGTDLGILFKEALGEKLGLSPATFTNEHRMLNDFHLNSLFVGQFLSGFATANGLKFSDNPLEYANASVGELIEVFRLLNEGDRNVAPEPDQHAAEKKEPEGIEAWVHGFEMTNIELPLIPSNGDSPAAATYATCGTIPAGFKNRLSAVAPESNTALIVFLYGDNDQENIQTILECIQHVKNNKALQKLLFLQQAPIGTGFAKSLFQETGSLQLTVITVDPGTLTPGLVHAEFNSMKGFREIAYSAGKRYTVALEPLVRQTGSGTLLPGEEDVVLVTGGAKGITLECVRSLGKLTNCSFVLLGRSSPDTEEVRENLRSLTQSNIRFRYYAVDLIDQPVLANILQTTGPVTFIIHAAGINHPKRAFDLQEQDFADALAPKVAGLAHLLQLIDPRSLKCCISFGSVIAQTGMEGNADYALANEWLQRAMSSFAVSYAPIRFINIQWSVWGGTGMGQKLGVLESLRLKGIQPISLDHGIDFFLGLLQHPPVAVNILAMGRYGNAATLFHPPTANAGNYRFIENITVHYPGVELIAECSLSANTDLYLQDHVVEGKMIFPGVFGWEAMLQAVAVLTKAKLGALEIYDAEFLHPIIVEEGREKKIRIIVQRMHDQRFRAVIREESSAYKKDHFRAGILLHASRPDIKLPTPGGTALTAFEPEHELYGAILFHTGIFKQLNNYYEIGPYKCIAAAGRKSTVSCFSDFMPRNLLLGNAALNDAVLHAVQVCVPNRILLPVKVGSVKVYTLLAAEEIFITATEQGNTGDEFTYDITVTENSGVLLQQWNGVVFRAIAGGKQPPLTLLLASVALQRKVDELLGKRGFVSVTIGERSILAHVPKRTDGKRLPAKGSLSRSHANGTSLIATAEASIACDMEVVVDSPPAAWQALFNEDSAALIEYIQQETGEHFSTVATRVWCALECIRKIGLQHNTPLCFGRSGQDGTVYLEAGDYTLLTCNWLLKGKGSTVLAVLLKKEYEKQI